MKVENIRTYLRESINLGRGSGVLDMAPTSYFLRICHQGSEVWYTFRRHFEFVPLVVFAHDP